MEDQRIKRVIDLNTEETFLGIMRYFQVDHAVADFPHFPSEGWDELLVAANQLAEQTFHHSLDIGFVDVKGRKTVDSVSRRKILAELEFMVVTDRVTGRICFDFGDTNWGIELGLNSPNFAHKLYLEALTIRGFIPN